MSFVRTVPWCARFAPTSWLGPVGRAHFHRLLASLPDGLVIAPARHWRTQTFLASRMLPIVPFKGISCKCPFPWDRLPELALIWDGALRRNELNRKRQPETNWAPRPIRDRGGQLRPTGMQAGWSVRPAGASEQRKRVLTRHNAAGRTANSRPIWARRGDLARDWSNQSRGPRVASEPELNRNRQSSWVQLGQERGRLGQEALKKHEKGETSAS